MFKVLPKKSVMQQESLWLLAHTFAEIIDTRVVKGNVQTKIRAGYDKIRCYHVYPSGWRLLFNDRHPEENYLVVQLIESRQRYIAYRNLKREMQADDPDFIDQINENYSVDRKSVV